MGKKISAICRSKPFSIACFAAAAVCSFVLISCNPSAPAEKAAAVNEVVAAEALPAQQETSETLITESAALRPASANIVDESAEEAVAEEIAAEAVEESLAETVFTEENTLRSGAALVIAADMREEAAEEAEEAAIIAATKDENVSSYSFSTYTAYNYVSGTAPNFYSELLKAPATGVSLSQELQDFTYTACVDYGVPYQLALGVMYVESRFVPGVVSYGNYGLMQINSINHPRLRSALGVTDFLDAKSNILCGVYMLAELFSNYSDYEFVLMCYNQGVGSALSSARSGITSTGYSRAVMAKYYEYLGCTPPEYLTQPAPSAAVPAVSAEEKPAEEAPAPETEETPAEAEAPADETAEPETVPEEVDPEAPAEGEEPAAEPSVSEDPEPEASEEAPEESGEDSAEPENAEEAPAPEQAPAEDGAVPDEPSEGAQE